MADETTDDPNSPFADPPDAPVEAIEQAHQEIRDAAERLMRELQRGLAVGGSGGVGGQARTALQAWQRAA